jgi:RNA polymerase sigma-70 factor (ECF subfamily)
MNDMKRLDVISLIEPLRRYARVLTRDASQAEDLVQDTLVRAYERRMTFHAGGNLRAWLLSVLHNMFIDQQRRQKAESRRSQGMAEITPIAVAADQETRVRLQQIQQAFLSLPDEQRSALHLVTIEGLSYQEAATTLDIPIGTLMSRLGRARAALRAFEEGQSQDPRTAGKPRPALRIVGGSHD